MGTVHSVGRGHCAVWVLAALAVGLQWPALAGAQTTSTWGGGSGNWTNAALWSTNPNFPNNGTPPGTNYNAVINAGTVNLDQNITVTGLNLTGGTLNGGSNLTVTNLVLGGGTLATTGTLSVTNFSSTGGTLSRDLTLSGGTNSAAGTLHLNGSTFTLASGATLNFNNGSLSLVDGSGAVLINGTITETGPSYTLIRTSFSTGSSAIINVSGGLRLEGGGTQDGTFNVSGGKTLIVAGGGSFGANAKITGAGMLSIDTPNVETLFAGTGAMSR